MWHEANETADQAHRLLERARAARLASARLEAETHAGWGRALVTMTSSVDRRRPSVREVALLRDAAIRVGRDPSIEDAKQLLRARYGVTGEEAFDGLRRASQRRNRKLRDVAADLVAASKATHEGGTR